jgi:hypothetical protein
MVPMAIEAEAPESMCEADQIQICRTGPDTECDRRFRQ